MTHTLDAATDPLVALGDELGRVVATWQGVPQDARTNRRAEVQKDRLLRAILSLRARSLEGIAVQVRALSEFAAAFKSLDTQEGDDDLFLATLFSICGVLDRHLGVDRERWGGGYLLPSWCDPHTSVPSARKARSAA